MLPGRLINQLYEIQERKSCPESAVLPSGDAQIALMDEYQVSRDAAGSAGIIAASTHQLTDGLLYEYLMPPCLNVVGVVDNDLMIGFQITINLRPSHRQLFDQLVSIQT
jgi:hypothetical protein